MDSLPAEPQGSPRILEWVAYLFSRGSSWPRNLTGVLCFAGGFFINWAIREGWVLKNWCFQTVVLEKTLESPLDNQEIKPFNPKGSQPWLLIESTDAEAEAPILWPPDVKTQLTGKDPNARKYWGQEEKGMTEDEMVGWLHWLNGLEFDQTLGDNEGQGSWRAAVHGVTQSWTKLSNWTTRRMY